MKMIKSMDILNMYINKFNLNDIFNDVKNLIELHEFEIGEMILNEAEDQSYYYFLVDGKAKVCPTSEDGNTVLLDFMEPLDIIGDIEYVFKTPNYHGVMALKKTTLIAIPLLVVDEYMNENIYFYKFISELMAHKIERTSVKYARAILYPLKNRLARYLYEHYEDNLNPIIKIKFNETADYLGITDRHLRRIIVEFEEKNILQRKNGYLVVLDLSKLLEQASYM